MMKSSSLRNRLCPAAASIAALLLVLSALAAISAVDGFAPPIVTQVAGNARTDALFSSPRAAITTTPLLQSKISNLSLKHNSQQGGQRLRTSLFAVEPDSNNDSSIDSSSGLQKIYTPINRPLLAVVDTISLVVFAAIGKSSHSANGDLDIFAVLMTAFPFVTAWLTTSPLTGVYSPDDTSDESNVIVSTGMKVVKGWAIAVPLGIALRGVIKGYVPPTPFIIVTLISTLVILVGVRVLFAIAEDIFVEMVN